MRLPSLTSLGFCVTIDGAKVGHKKSPGNYCRSIRMFFRKFRRFFRTFRNYFRRSKSAFDSLSRM